MSDLGNFLSTQLEAQNISGMAMAARMGIDRSHFSQFINGRRQSCNIETLMKMAVGVSEDPTIQAGFLEAYFRDQCVERFKSWVSVDPESESGALLREDPPDADPIDELSRTLRSLRLTHKSIRALGDIARFIPGRHKFEVVIEDLGKFAREELTRGDDV